MQDYTVLIDTLDEIHQTTRDEYGLKAAGLLSTMSTLFGLKLGELVFGASETLSKSLQGKDTTIQEAIAAVKLAKCFYTQQRRDGPFLLFYDDVVKVDQKYNISAPQLPRYRRIPKRLNDGIEGRYATPQDYFRHQYFQALDLLIAGLDDRFDQSEVLGPVLDLENLLLKSANGANFNVHLASFKSSCYKDDFNWEQLNIQLLMYGNLVKEALPMVKEVTNVCTICDGMNKSNTYKTMLPEVHNLLRLYLTIPITSATSERSFSALKRVLTYLKSTMTEERLNHCLLLHIHKNVTDTLDIKEIAKDFINTNLERLSYFGSFEIV